MATRQEIQAKMEATLAKGEEKFAVLKAELEEAGDSASQESKDALAAMQKSLEKLSFEIFGLSARRATFPQHSMRLKHWVRRLDGVHLFGAKPEIKNWR